MSLLLTGEQELQRLSRALRVYEAVGRLTLADLLYKKAYDLRIKLYRGYRDARWKGSRKGSMQSRGVAFTEMRRRARQGEGVIFARGRKDPKKGTHPENDRRGRKLSPYQLQVWQELRRRQSGIGILAVSFLLKRWIQARDEHGKRIRVLRKNNTKLDLISETHTQESGSGKIMSRVTLTGDSARIEGFTDGLAAVGNRTGIVPAAIRAVSLDTEIYLSRKLGEDWDAVSRDFALGAHA